MNRCVLGGVRWVFFNVKQYIIEGHSKYNMEDDGQILIVGSQV